MRLQDNLDTIGASTGVELGMPYRPTRPLDLMLSTPPLSTNLENTLSQLQAEHAETVKKVAVVTAIVGSGSAKSQSKTPSPIQSAGSGTISLADDTGLFTFSGSPASLGGTITIEAFANTAISINTSQLVGTISNAQLANSTVGLTDSTGLFTVTGSPASLGGSLTLSAFAPQSQNTVLAGPSSSSGAASFRLLVAADIPSLSATYLPLSGGTMTGVLTLESSAAGLKDSAGSAGSSGQVLSINGSGNTVWASPATGGTVTSVGFTGGLISVATPTSTPAFTVAGTSGGIPYFSSATTWASSALLASGGVVLGGGSGTAPATNTHLTFATNTLTIGLAGTGSGILSLAGSTSGNVTFTAPAVAGTVANPVISSNAIVAPNLSASFNGTTATLVAGDLSCARSTDTGAIIFGTSATVGSGGSSYWFWDSSTMQLGTGANLNLNGGIYESSGNFGISHASTAITAITLSGGIVIAITTSDERLKKNITPFTKGLDALLNIKPITFEWDESKSPMKSDHAWTGFSAQQVAETLPEASFAVPDDNNGSAKVKDLLDFNSQTVLAAAVNAIKELSARIVILEGRLNG